MRAWIVLGLFCAAFALTGATCLQRNAEGLSAAGEVAKKVAPALPPPFNWLLALAGAGIGVVGSIYSGKRKAAAFAAGGQSAAAALSAPTKMLAERKYLLPLLGAGVVAAKASGLLPLETPELVGILTMLGIPTVGEFVADHAAKAAAPRPPPPAGGAS
jgi:hypothetical protein